MTKEENRPAGCVLRLFGAPEQTVQKAVAALPDTWQGTVHCRTRGAETLVALQSSTPQQLRRAVQLLRTSLALALYGEGEQTLAAAAVQALEQHRKLLVCSDAAAGALLETRLENLPGAEKVFDFGAMSYANAALNARLSRKLRKAPQAEPARTLARVQAMQRLTGAALAVGCVDFGGESCVPLIDQYDNLLVVQTFSKSRQLAGARLGLAMGNAALIADLNRVKFSLNPYNINRLTLKAGQAALEDTAYFEKTRAAIMDTRAWTMQQLTDRGFTVLDSRANFVFASTDRINGGVLYKELKKKGILVRHFDAPRIENWLRITIGTPEQMQALMDAVDKILEV